MTTEEKAKAFDDLAMALFLAPVTSADLMRCFAERMRDLPPMSIQAARARLMSVADHFRSVTHETA